MIKYQSLLFFAILLSIAACSSSKQEVVANFTVEQIASPTDSTTSEPFLYGDNNKVYLSWIEERDTIASLLISQLEENSWSSPTRIATGHTWFVNWADYPTIASNGKNLIAHFLDRSSDGKFSYDVKYTVSADGGANWQSPKLLNEDNKDAEHGFVSLVPYGENFFAAWLDGRNTMTEGMDHAHGHGSMSLRAAIIDPNGNKINEWELDDRTCDCCQTTAAITPSGPVVIYRDRSKDEVRDISITRFVNDQWTEPRAINKDNWEIAGCPVNGPRSSVKGKTLAVAWFTSAADSSRVNVAFSNNSGESFGDAIQISGSNTLGRVDIALIDDDAALVTWIEDKHIKMMKVTSDGGKSDPIIVSNTSDARSSGFPQLTISGQRAIVAWTDDEEGRIKTAAVRL